MPIEVTPRTALSNFLHLHGKFFGQFLRLVRTKIWPSSIIIRYVGNYVYTGYVTVIVCHATHNFKWKLAIVTLTLTTYRSVVEADLSPITKLY